MQEHRNRIVGLSSKLDALNPVNTMNRGFAIAVHTKDGSILKSVDETEPGERLRIFLRDGTVDSVVSGKEKHMQGDLYEEVIHGE